MPEENMEKIKEYVKQYRKICQQRTNKKKNA